jgi:predicted porin
MSVDYIDAGDFDGWAVNGGNDLPGEGRANRLGVKGSEDLGNGLKAIYQIEFGVEMAEEGGSARNAASGSGDSLSMRNSFVGFAGGWGTALVGRHDTPLKISTGKLDLFGDTMADYNGTIGFADRRVDNAIAYISPSFAGFQLAAATHVGGGATATGTALDATGNIDSDDLNEAWSVAGIYKNGPFYGSAAYESLSEDLILADDDFTQYRFGLGLLDWNGFTLAGVYENQDDGDDSADLWQISAGYAFGNNMVKGFYGENDAEGIDSSSWAVGFDHNFSKRTTAYALYTDTDADSDDDDWSGFSLGVIHNF